MFWPIPCAPTESLTNPPPPAESFTNPTSPHWRFAQYHCRKFDQSHWSPWKVCPIPLQKVWQIPFSHTESLATRFAESLTDPPAPAEILTNPHCSCRKCNQSTSPCRQFDKSHSFSLSDRKFDQSHSHTQKVWPIPPLLTECLPDRIAESLNNATLLHRKLDQSHCRKYDQSAGSHRWFA